MSAPRTVYEPSFRRRQALDTPAAAEVIVRGRDGRIRSSDEYTQTAPVLT